MTGDLLEEYDKVLERLENIDGATKSMVFHLLGIHSKEVLDKLLILSDEELIKVLQMPIEEIIKI